MTEVLIVTAADRALLAQLGPHAGLERKLARAIVVSSTAVPPDVVTMNSQVVYTDETVRQCRTVTLVYPSGSGEDGLSVLSPAGTALLGMSAGQVAHCDFPDGSRRRLRVEHVLRQPERLLGLAVGA